MIKVIQFISMTAALFFCQTTMAAITCSGCTDSYTNITNTLSSGDNAVGTTLSSADVSLPARTVTGYANGKAQGFLYYIGDSIPAAGTSPGTWQYKRVDDYISVALKASGPCGTSYAPYNTTVLSTSTCNELVLEKGRTYNGAETSYQSQIRIDKKMVGGTYSTNIAFAELGRCQPAGCNNLEVSFGKVWLNLNITVPQSCEINAGNTITVDFGSIPSGRFNTAGAKPEGVNPVTKSIAIACTNVDAQASMSLRIQADTVSGNAVVSDNSDVGFVVADGSGNPLTPNNTSSVISFTLDDSDTPSASVPIQVYPVSVTGNIPTEGDVTSRAYLRVDFD